MTLASHSTIEQNAKEPWMVRLNEFVQVQQQQQQKKRALFFLGLCLKTNSLIFHFKL